MEIKWWGRVILCWNTHTNCNLQQFSGGGESTHASATLPLANDLKSLSVEDSMDMAQTIDMADKKSYRP